uniref:hypothetical protein n=1 Tax=Diaphorobacter nitroreducens TaxID=164759 RepID=UPI00406A6257
PRPGRSVLGAVKKQNPGAAVAAPGVQGQQPNQNAAVFAVAQAAALEQPSIRPAHTCALRLSPGESPAGYPRRAMLGAP